MNIYFAKILSLNRNEIGRKNYNDMSKSVLLKKSRVILFDKKMNVLCAKKKSLDTGEKVSAKMQFLSGEEYPKLDFSALPEEDLMYLGQIDYQKIEDDLIVREDALFAACADWDEEMFGEGVKFSGVMSVMAGCSEVEKEIYVMSWNLLKFVKKNRFCHYCGEKNNVFRGGTGVECSSGHVTFPTVNPVVIALLTNHNDECLLVTQPQWEKKKFYSCIAGFIDPGESIEESIIREIKEEVGINAIKESIQYFGSQAFPVPHGSNLMLGVEVKTKEYETKVDGDEISGAIWFSKDEVRQLLDQKKNETGYTIPPPFAIANQMLTKWVNN